MNRKEIAHKIIDGVSETTFKSLTTFLNAGSKGMYMVLKVLVNATNEVTAGDISSALKVSTARIAVALKVLEKKKYIKRYKSLEDARKTIVEITPEGKKAYKENENNITNVIDSFLNKLTDQEVLQLLNIMKKGLSNA